MKTTELVFLGASTAFHEVMEIIRAINKNEMQYDVIAILDDNENLHGKILEGIKVTGYLSDVNKYKTQKFVFGIGSMKTRLVRHEIINHLGVNENRYESIIHPSADINSSAEIGFGCIIHTGVCIGYMAKVESFSIIAVNSAIGPYAILGKFSMITSLVIILTNSKIGRSAFIGSGSCITENVKIGAGAMVGVGSVISRNLEPGCFILGNPPRVIKKDIVSEELLD